MEYEYKGTVYEFPDDMDDKKALELIRIDQGEIKKPSKQPKLKSIGSTRSFEQLPYKERVQQRADELALRSLSSTQRDPGIINRALAPARQFTGTMTAHLNEALPYRLPGMIEKAIPGKVKTVAETLAKATPGLNALYTAKVAKEKAIPAVAGKVAEKTEALPEKLKNIAGIGMDVAQMIPAAGIGKEVGAKTVQSGLKKGASVADDLAGRIQGTKVKILSPEFKKGAANKLYTKYNVFGTAKQVQKKWKQKITDTYSKVRQKIEKSDTALDPDNYTFVNDIFEQAEKTAVKYGKSPTGTIAVKKELSKLRDIFDEAYPDGKIDLVTAQLEKQVTGKKGDWLAKSGQISGNANATISSQAHNTLYDALKKVVENKGSPGIRELNKQLSEMIPMERAASKQVLVADRKNIIPIDDYIGGLAVATSAASGNLLPALVAGANVATKSHLVAKGLYGAGKGMKKIRNVGSKKISLPSGKNVKSIVGNQKGEIGVGGSMSMSTDILPAIKDPQTGKVYVGNRLYGHKFVSAKGETEAIKNRLQNEYFKDNMSAGNTSTVGFIDKKGNFISRQEAEAMMTRPRSLAQQFYPIGVLGATGATAAAGLTGYEMLKNKEK